MKRNTAVVAVFLVAAAVSAYWWAKMESSADSSSDSSPSAATADGELLDSEEGNSAVPANSTSYTVKRSLVASYGENTSILTDVADRDIDHKAIEGFLSARPIGAYRIVSINSDLLRAKTRQAGGDGAFEIVLFAPEPLPLVPIEAEDHQTGWRTGLASWRGQIDGLEGSKASFVISPDGTVNGVIRSPELGRVKIEPIEGSIHHIIWLANSDIRRKID